MAARVSKVDECMFCGNTPCTCRSAKKAAPKPRASRKKSEAPIAESNTRSVTSSQSRPSQKADVTAAMRAAAKVKHHGHTVKEDNDAVDEEAAILADPEFTAAIQAVGPLMHPIERKRFEAVLEAKPDHRSRAAAWKERTRG